MFVKKWVEVSAMDLIVDYLVFVLKFFCLQLIHVIVGGGVVVECFIFFL